MQAWNKMKYGSFYCTVFKNRQFVFSITRHHEQLFLSLYMFWYSQMKSLMQHVDCWQQFRCQGKFCLHDSTASALSSLNDPWEGTMQCQIQHAMGHWPLKFIEGLRVFIAKSSYTPAEKVPHFNSPECISRAIIFHFAKKQSGLSYTILANNSNKVI